ncbi:probable ATP-dependent helicase PF08_0048 [Vespa mandarinia]|uniref:probable ATP-dependent helicase PF08_0048 n=1 Tax=Vespa mandarinia TaxID=7446 RepID=UPI0016180F2B|nr:probable ATP-dependent helicase PF08_0048 [Vespa mandarinia]
MTNKLAFKHKNSMALNEKKMISQESGSKSSHLYSKPFRIPIFLIITCCIFLGYWFIMCPLIWALLSHSSFITHAWPKFWSIIFWIVALIIWIFIMIFLISIWKCIKDKHNINVKKRSYGSDSTNYPSQSLGEDIQPMIAKDKSNDKTSIDFDLSSKDYDKKSINNSKATDNTIQKHSKRKRDLPPLVIHRKMSKNDIENVNIVTTEKSQKKDDEELQIEDIQETNVNRNSIKNYLKLVTVTPSEENKNITSPKTPMSPRDLFFIDLIREAEKAEKNKESEKEDLSKRRWFLPEHTIPSILNSIDSKTNNSDNKNSKKDDSDKDNKDDEKQVERELNYFIADIESPKNEKTEIFIEINKTLETDSKKESIDLCTVKMNENNPILAFENKFAEKDGLKENRDM